MWETLVYNVSPHLIYLLQTDLLKPRCVKTKLSAISSLGLGWKILQMLQPLRKPFADGRSGWRIRPFNCFSPLADVSAGKSKVLWDLENSQDSFKTYHYPRSDTKKDNFPGTKRSKSLEKMPGRSPGTVDSKWGSCRSCRQVKKISSFLKKVLFFC